jgi:hypothetical protein
VRGGMGVDITIFKYLCEQRGFDLEVSLDILQTILDYEQSKNKNSH